MTAIAIEGRSGRRTDGRRRATIVAGSLLLHVLLLAWLALPVPPLVETFVAEDLPTITLQLSRRAPEEPPKPRRGMTTTRPLPVPLAPIQPRAPARPAPTNVPTLGVPGASLARPGTAIRPAPLPGDGVGDLRSALRSSTGCLSADVVGLTRREREACEERFGAARAKGDPLSGLDAAKRQALDAAAAAQDAYRRYKENSMGPGVDHRSKEHPGTMKEIPFVLGAEQDGLGRPRQDVINGKRRDEDNEARARKFLELQKEAGQRR